jgi:hypothetical protein
VNFAALRISLGWGRVSPFEGGFNIFYASNFDLCPTFMEDFIVI